MLKALRSPQFVHDFTLGITPLLFGFNLLTSIGFLPHAIQGKADFRQIYAAAYMVWTGHSHELFSYEAQEDFQNRVVSHEQYALPFIRPASQALLFVPLAWFSYPTAYRLFFILNLLLLAICFVLLQPWMRNLAVDSRWKPLTVFLSFTPLAYGLTQGQDAILLLTLLAGALCLIRREQFLPAGVLAGLGSFKFQLTIPIFLLFFFWRKWRFCAGFACAAFALALTSIWVTGIEQARVYALSLFALGFRESSSRGLLRYAPGLTVAEMPNLHGLLHELLRSVGSSPLVNILVVALAILWLWRDARDASPDRQWLIAMTASVVLSYYAFMADLSILLAPLLAMLDTCASPAIVKGRAWLVCASVSVLLAPACLWFFPLQFYLASIPTLLLLVGTVATHGAGRQNLAS
jgi:hypothetical protein